MSENKNINSDNNNNENNNTNTDNNTEQKNNNSEQINTKCSCSFSCCEFNKLYQVCNDKLKNSVEEIINLKNNLEELYKSRSTFEKTTQQNITIESANALLVIYNVLKNILENNPIKDIKNIQESAMFNACKIALNQLLSVFLKLNIHSIEPLKGDIYDSNMHNAISVVSDSQIENNSIVFVVEPGAYYKSNGNKTLIKAAAVIININQQ